MAPAQGFGDRSCYTVRVAKHVVVPKADDAITFGFNQPGPLFITCLTVLPAIDFDDELAPVAGKVGLEISDGHLPAEMLFWEVFAQQVSHCLLGICRIVAKAPHLGSNADGWAVTHSET